jgi:aconitate hydratase
MYLGVRGVIAKTFARIHRANLVNWGVLPLEFADPADYDGLRPGSRLRITGVHAGLTAGTLGVEDETAGRRFGVRCVLTAREREILLAGGRLAHTRSSAPGGESQPPSRQEASDPGSSGRTLQAGLR